ncbi:MAG: alpha/beta hydrolase [Chloroflexi bacterium]|nr:alpha/beta hydrolase [Chloroflexota bacterium]
MSGKKPLGRWNWVIITVVILMVLITPMSLYAAADIEKKDLDDTTRSQLGGSYTKLTDGITHYEISGPADGQVVVLIHGPQTSMWVWDAQINDFTKAGFRILRYDQFGKGYSDRPDANYSQEFYRKQLLDLLNTLGIQKPVDLVGTSMGGGLAVDFTANYPDRVRKLVLVDPIINSVNNGFYINVLRIPLVGEFLMRMITTNSSVQQAIELTKNSPKAAQYESLFKDQIQYKGSERAALSMFRSDATSDYRADYQTVGRQGKPVMLIWDTRNDDISGEMLQEMQKALPQVEFTKLDGIGQNPQLKVPDCFDSLVIEFLKK